MTEIDLNPYTSEWVVICKDKVIAHNKQLKNLESDIKNCNHPTLMLVPGKEAWIF